MTSRHTPETLVPIGEAAELLSVSIDTLRRWSNAGTVPVIVLPSGQRRYRVGDLEAILTPRGGAA